uniref:polynucleotide adenylyltransferase n=1 Tax=Salix viminalis TaxID=40686 RepID=A0A6N2M2U9_SALVM
MVNEGLFPSPEEEEKRKIIVEKLKTIVVAWAKKVAWQRCLPKQQIAATSATILTHGSHGLGVHDPESDIDALCVGPFFATIADFFIVLRNILKSRPEISEIHCVKDSKFPLMRFKFDGISVDLPYAQLKVLNVPENVDVLSLSLLNNIDETSWKSLSGVRANQRILLLVPNLKVDIPCFFFPIHTRTSTLDLFSMTLVHVSDLVSPSLLHFLRFYLPQLEAVQGFCDPNPMEYVDMDVSEPNVVFYWGLNQ